MRPLFAEAFRILTLGGHLLVTTPNVAKKGSIVVVGRKSVT